MLWWSLSGCVDPASAPAVPAASASVAPATSGADCPATTEGFGADPRFAGEHVVVVHKSQRRAALYEGGALAGCWRVALGSAGDAGPKRREGDSRTPEGWYRTSDRPRSQFYHAITLHYPNTEDADRALAEGAIDGATRDLIAAAIADGEVPPQDTPLGSHLLLHGGGSASDWTLGCVAFDDADIDALRAALPADKRTWVWLAP